MIAAASAAGFTDAAGKDDDGVSRLWRGRNAERRREPPDERSLEDQQICGDDGDDCLGGSAACAAVQPAQADIPGFAFDCTRRQGVFDQRRHVGDSVRPAVAAGGIDALRTHLIA